MRICMFSYILLILKELIFEINYLTLKTWLTTKYECGWLIFSIFLSLNIGSVNEQKLDKLTCLDNKPAISSFLYHKWIHEKKEIKLNIDLTKSLKQIQPLLEETVQKKYTTAKMWDSFQGWRGSTSVVWPSRTRPRTTRPVTIWKALHWLPMSSL